MIPHSLKLVNFIGIRAGLGLDEIYLDLDSLAGGASLIALKGPNGKGKSTILDNLHPFRVMPSRAGSYSPRSFSFYDNTFGDAEKVLEWSHDTERYRSILKIKGAGKAKKTEAYLQQRLDEWVPVVLPDWTSSDGKADTYDRCVEHILGTPEMFFTAVFAAQNRTPLSAYKNGEIKALMSELLGLDHILELGGQANEVVKLLTARLNGCKQELGQSGNLEQAREAADSARAGALTTIRTQEPAKQLASEKVRELTQELALVQANAGNLESIDKQRRELNEQITELQQSTDARANEITQDIDREQGTLQQLTNAHHSQDGSFALRAKEAGQRLENYQALLAQSEAITAAINRVEELSERDTRTGAELQTMEENAGKLATVTETRANVRARFEGLKQSGQRLAGELKRAEEQSKLAGEVPCTGTDLQPRCKLLEGAIKAEKLIPNITVELDTRRSECEACKTEESGLTAQIDAFGDIQTALSAKRIQHREIRAELDKANELAGKESLLEQAETEADRLHQELADIGAQRDTACREYDANRKVSEARIRELGQQIIDAREAGQGKITALQERLTTLNESDTAEKIRAGELVLQQAEDNLKSIEQTIIDRREQVAALDAQIAALDEKIAAAQETRALADGIESELSTWRLLATGLGNDGIVALSIDDAGPTLASLTNDLLLSAYGPRFTVSISTQAQTKAGTDKETFDVLVFDGDRDEQKSVRSMSGGERIWINECLTRAIALYQAQQSGQSYGCLFADESDGALDPERKEMFIRMKRKVMELGGYEREFFISHTPALWDLADAVIDMEQLVA